MSGSKEPRELLQALRVLLDKRRAKAGCRDVQAPRPELVHLVRKRLKAMSGLYVAEQLLEHPETVRYLAEHLPE